MPITAGVTPLPAMGGSKLEEAHRLMGRGKVLEARRVLESLLPIAPAAALHELGRSYDPHYLSQLDTIDSGSEPKTAAALYHEAIISGSVLAGSDLDRLRASQPNTRDQR